MSDFDEKLSAILGNQDAMSQIMSLAQSLSAPESGENCSQTTEEGGECPALPECFSLQSRDARLLEALRPYLKDSRQKKLDKALELLQVIRLLKGSRE